ncbi:HNH endonuclease signature motif containing protein [Eoetvoesiella caeni]
MKQHKPPALPGRTRTLQDKQQANGRTLALTSAAWRRLRDVVLSRDPICRHCWDDYERITPSTDVDHVDNNPANNDLDNLQGLCHSCHSRKTNVDRGRSVAHGCDAQGRPLCPDHHWNQKSPATEGQ